MRRARVLSLVAVLVAWGGATARASPASPASPGAPGAPAAAATPAAAASPPVTDTGWLTLGAATFVLRSVDGSFREFYRSCAEPAALRLTLLDLGVDFGPRRLLQFELHDPGGEDALYRLRGRDARAGDVEVSVLQSAFYDRPRDEPATRQQGEVSATLRSWRRLRLASTYSFVREAGAGSLRDRDGHDQELALEARFDTPEFDAAVRGAVARYQDDLRPTEDKDRLQLDLTVFRQLAERATLEFSVGQREASRPAEDVSVRETDLRLTGRLYGPFDAEDLRLQGDVHYAARPSSFVENVEDEKRLETSLDFLWLAGRGALSGGIEDRHFDLGRLPRTTIDEVLAAPPGTPSHALQRTRLRELPRTLTAWVRGVVDESRIFSVRGTYRDRTAAGVPATDYGLPGAASLYPSGQKTADYQLVLAPRRPVNLTVTRTQETRRWEDPDRMLPGQTRRNQTDYLLSVGCFKRFHGTVSATELRQSATDLEVAPDLTGDYRSVGATGRVKLSQHFSLFGSHTSMKSVGATLSREHVLSYGIDYDRVGPDGLSFTLALGRDAFEDERAATNDYRARTLSLSGELEF